MLNAQRSALNVETRAQTLTTIEKRTGMRKDRALHTQVRQRMDSIRTPNNVEYIWKQKKGL